jgi:hypothetical protein
MAVDGQRDPIKVVAQPKSKARPWRLVTGMHRLVGARLEGIQVFAVEVSESPKTLRTWKHRRTCTAVPSDRSSARNSRLRWFKQRNSVSPVNMAASPAAGHQGALGEGKIPPDAP